MPRILNPNAKEKLSNRDWLQEMHCSQLYSIIELSTLLQCTPASIAKAIKTHDLIVPSQQQLRQASLRRKYGIENVSQLKDVKTKVSKRLKDRSQELKHQRESTSLQKYGTRNAGHLFAGKNKRQGRNNHITEQQWELLENPEWLRYQHHDLQRSILSISKDIGVWDTTVASKLDFYGIEKKRFFSSEGEKQLADFIKSVYNGVLLQRDNSLGFEIDIFLPEKNLAIEYCGLYYHSEQMGKTKYYHHHKWLRCKQQGIQLLTIFEDEWLFSRQIVESSLLSKLGLLINSIYARDTTIVSNVLTTNFIQNNHIQGSSKAKYHYALQYGSEIVAAMQVQDTTNGLLISRYCSSARVVGGFGKLFAHLRKLFPTKNIYTFADHRWSDGNLYIKHQPDEIVILDPDYCYAGPGCNNKRVHKFNFRHKHLRTRLKSYNPTLTEVQNCNNNGMWRIWDCGKTKYIWHAG